MNAKEAFETLLRIATDAQRSAQKSGAAYLAEGDTAHALERIKNVDTFRALARKIAALQEEWVQALPLEGDDIPILVLGEPTPPGEQTSEKKYWLPLLQALVEMGGSGATADVIDRVGEIMREIFSEQDYEQVEAGEIRWRNRTRWVRADLVEAGYLSKDAAHGVWEITAEGRRYLRDRQGG